MHAVHNEKKRHKGYYVVAVILGLIIFNPFHVADYARNILVAVFSPVSAVSENIGFSVQNSVEMILSIGRLHQDNQDLRRLNGECVSQNERLKDIENENRLLREDLDLLPRDEYNLEGAEIVMRDALGGNQWVMINRGEKHGLQENMPVIVGESIFIGYVDKVDISTARVRLLTHPRSVVNIVNVRNGAEAIAYGSHGLSVVVRDIQKDADVKNGDTFVTSQIGARFPRGLTIGVVQNISTSRDHLFQQASLAPRRSLEDIRFVYVIK